MPSVLSASRALKATSKLRTATKHAGRKRDKYSFEATGISVAGLPDRPLDSGCQELVVQLARGPKIASCSVDVPGGHPAGGAVSWGEQKLTFVATLYSSKTGKDFSDKRYRASLLAAKPVDRGGKRQLREVGHVDFNLSDFANSATPTALPSWQIF